MYYDRYSLPIALRLYSGFTKMNAKWNCIYTIQRLTVLQSSVIIWSNSLINSFGISELRLERKPLYTKGQLFLINYRPRNIKTLLRFQFPA